MLSVITCSILPLLVSSLSLWKNILEIGAANFHPPPKYRSCSWTFIGVLEAAQRTYKGRCQVAIKIRCSSPNIPPRKLIFAFLFSQSCSFCHYPMITTMGEVWKVSGKALQVLLGRSYLTSGAAQFQSSQLRSSFYPHSCTRPRDTWGPTVGVLPPTCKSKPLFNATTLWSQTKCPMTNWSGVVRDTDLGNQQIHIGCKEQKSLSWRTDSTVASTDKEAMLGYQLRQKHLFNRWKGEPGVWWWAAGLATATVPRSVWKYICITTHSYHYNKQPR